MSLLKRSTDAKAVETLETLRSATEEFAGAFEWFTRKHPKLYIEGLDRGGTNILEAYTEGHACGYCGVEHRNETAYLLGSS